MDLKQLRDKIDRIDGKIIDLLNNRMEFALRARKLKKQTRDQLREEEVLNYVMRRSQRLVDPKFSDKIFRSIIEESKRIQDLESRLAGFQGEHGAYSEVAIKRFDNGLVPIPCTEFAEVFDGVKTGQLDLGILPVENSLAGAISQVNDMLVETDLKIVGEVYVPVHHCLLAPPETDYREIRAVYSHPQALAQCRGFITRNKLEAKQYYDTAGAAMMIAHEKPVGAAAIANSLCAEMYDLEVLKENIEDHETNTTRFLVMSREKSKEKGNKCSVVFSTAHKAGALFSVLKLFSDANLNLTRIESRPLVNESRRYAFLLDFTGSDEDGKVTDLLERMKKETVGFRFLGCYKEGTK